MARHHLQFMLENVRIAGELGLPLCQDTGLAIFHVQMGRDLKLDFGLSEAIAEGVRIATKRSPCAPMPSIPRAARTAGTTPVPACPT